MKKLLLLIFLLSISAVFAQTVVKTETVTDHSIHIIGDDFEGVIFFQTYFQNTEDSAEMKIKRFTPTNEDIILTESLLKAQVKHKNKGDRKYIFANLKKYRRQYIGYINKDGDKVIYINCFSVDEDWADKKIKKADGSLITTWYDKLFYVFDGGNSFWQTNINLKRKKILGISVNGVA